MTGDETGDIGDWREEGSRRGSFDIAAGSGELDVCRSPAAKRTIITRY